MVSKYQVSNKPTRKEYFHGNAEITEFKSADGQIYGRLVPSKSPVDRTPGKQWWTSKTGNTAGPFEIKFNYWAESTMEVWQMGIKSHRWHNHGVGGNVAITLYAMEGTGYELHFNYTVNKGANDTPNSFVKAILMPRFRDAARHCAANSLNLRARDLIVPWEK